MVLCACFPNRTPPSCLQESRFPNTKNNSFRGGHVSSGNSPFPQPEGRRPSCAIVPGWCWFPLHPRVAWSSTSGWLQKLKNYSPNFVGFWIPSLTSAALEERPTVFFGSSSWRAFSCIDLFHRQLMIFSLGLVDLFLQPPMYFSLWPIPLWVSFSPHLLGLVWQGKRCIPPTCLRPTWSPSQNPRLFFARCCPGYSTKMWPGKDPTGRSFSVKWGDLGEMNSVSICNGFLWWFVHIPQGLELATCQWPVPALQSLLRPAASSSTPCPLLRWYTPPHAWPPRACRLSSWLGLQDVELNLVPDESLVFGPVAESPVLLAFLVSGKTQCPPPDAPCTTVPIQLLCACSSSFSFSAPTCHPMRHPTNTNLLHPLHNRLLLWELP